MESTFHQDIKPVQLTPTEVADATTDTDMAAVSLAPLDLAAEHPEENVATEMTEDAASNSKGHSALRIAKGALESAMVTVEATPGVNEIIRSIPFTAAMAEGAPPVVSGLILGAATFAMEGGAALATPDLLRTRTGEKFMSWISKKMPGFISQEARMSPVMEAGVAYLAGTAVVLAERHREDPSRTRGENVRHGMFTAGWLGSTLAVQGTLVAEGIHTPSPVTIGAAVIAAGSIPVAARWAKNRGEQRELPIDDRMDHHKGLEYRVIKDADSLEKAAVMEQKVWDEQGFGNLEEEGYGPHIANSRTFACFEGDECVGVTRMFKGKQEEDDVMLPPFIHLPFYDESLRDYLAEKTLDGTAEELGTTAVVNDARGKGVNTRMWRLAYRDAVARGVDTWAIIMEPERVEKLNRVHGFTLRQVGPAIDYQGGDCAVHVMDLEEVRINMRNKHPLAYYWFGKKALKSK